MSKTMLHFHTESSRYDSAAKIKDMCKRAKELGYTSLGLTEHGVLTSTFDFMDICREMELQPIPGVEVYVGSMKSHLCLYPKSDLGFSGISKLVSESFQATIPGHPLYDGKDKPIVSDDMLEKYFGQDSQYHGQVIASSACVKGVLCDVLNQNAPINKKLEKLKKKSKEITSKYLHKIPENYEEIHNKVIEGEARLKEISELLTPARKIAIKKVGKEEKILAKFQEGEDGYEEAKEILEAKKKEIADAKQLIVDLTQEKESIMAFKKANKKTIETIKKVFEQQIKTESLEFELEYQLKSEEECYKETIQRLYFFRSVFGVDDFYVELQYHGIDIEKKYMPIILEIAKKTNVKWIVTNDAHMVSNSSKEIEARDFIRGMRYTDVYYPMETADNELYIKTEDEMLSMLSEIFSEEDIKIGFSNNDELSSKCHVELAHENHYPVFQSDRKGESSADYLKRLCAIGIQKKFGDTWTEECQKRLDYELEVIINMGYADYHCIVADYIQYGKLIGKIDFTKYEKEYYENPYDIAYLTKLVEDTHGVGEGIGPGRGSAAGSLVCYVIDITDVNPIKYNLLFERFLNPERVSMPDIDVDFSGDIREKVIEYVRYKYGNDAVCLILTTGMLWARKAIRNVARVYGLKTQNNKLYYRNLADEMCKKIPNELNIRFKDFLYSSSETDENGNVIISKVGLMEQYAGNIDAQKILSIAENLEGTFIDYGMHAAGVVISDNNPVDNYLPLMCNDKKNIVCQCVKERVEEYGLLKMDVRIVR